MRLLPLLLFPFVELWLMIVIGDVVGALAVIGWVGLMIFLGVNLLRYLGASSMLKAAQNMRSGELPGMAIAEGLFKAIGAVLLIVPGFITDAMALVCFLPWFRRLLIQRWVAKMTIRAAGFARQRSPFGRQSGGNTYDHVGPAADTSEKPKVGMLIDQEKSPSSDTSIDSDPKNRL